jgi:hypothetical protein
LQQEEKIFFRLTVDDRVLRNETWKAQARVRELQEQVQAQLVAARQRARRRRLLERGAAAAPCSLAWFLILVAGRVPVLPAAAVAFTFTLAFVAVLWLAGEIAPEDLGRVRPRRRR